MDPYCVLLNNLPSDDDDVRQHPVVKKAVKKVHKAGMAALAREGYFPIFKQPVVKKVVYKKSKKARKGMTALAYFKLFKEPMPEFVRRGPKMMGDEEFDEQCAFGNNVEMTPDQVAKIRKQVAFKPPIPYYVCKMTWSNVIAGKAKMYFSAKYTNAHLDQYLPMQLPVLCGYGRGFRHVRFVKCSNGVAQMTSNWKKVADAAGLKDGDLCMFTFLHSALEGLLCNVACLK